MIGELLVAGGLSVGAIVARAKEVDLQIHDLSARVRMTVFVEGRKRERVFDLSMIREGVNYRAVITLLEPPEMAGTRFLILAERGKRNRQWVYFPDLDMLRSIPGRHQDDPFLGSDITYSDLAGGAHLDDLVHRLVGEEEVDGEACYVMEGIPRHRIVYGKMRGWVRKDNFVTVRGLFLDREEKPLKEARLTDLREVKGVPLAHRITMRSLVEDRHTVLLLEAVRVNQGLLPELFRESALKGSSTDESRD
ncbi:MAG: outer membrane lipoprotein-sorting protein [Acidobacteriota bacterium]